MRKHKAMTLIETVVALAIIAICFVVFLRLFSAVDLAGERLSGDEAMTNNLSALIVELESAPPQTQSGDLDEDWRYETKIENGVYVLEIENVRFGERHSFVLRERANEET